MNAKLQEDVNILDIFRAIASGWKTVVTFVIIGFLVSLIYINVEKKDTIMSIDMYPVLDPAHSGLEDLYYDAVAAQSALQIPETIAKFSNVQVLNAVIREMLLAANDQTFFIDMIEVEQGKQVRIDVAATQSRLPDLLLNDINEEMSIWRLNITAGSREVALQVFDYLVDVSIDRTESIILTRAAFDRQVIQENLIFQNINSDKNDELLLRYYELNRKIAEDLGIDAPLRSNVVYGNVTQTIVPNYSDGVSVLNYFIDDLLENSPDVSNISEELSGNYYLGSSASLDLGGVSFFSTPFPPMFSYSRNDLLIVISAAFLFGLFGSVMSLVVYFDRIKSLG